MSLCCLFMSVALTFVTISASYKKFSAGFTQPNPLLRSRGRISGPHGPHAVVSTRQIAPHARGDCYVRAGRPRLRLRPSAWPRVGKLQRTLRLRVLGWPTSRGVGARDCRADVVQPRWRPTRRRDALLGTRPDASISRRWPQPRPLIAAISARSSRTPKSPLTQ